MGIDRIFIIGLVYGINNNDHENVESLKLFDRKRIKVYTQSFNKTAEQFLEGVNIIGLVEKDESSLLDEWTFEDKKYPMLNATNYDYKKLPVLNENGDVIKPGKEIVIGKIKIVSRTRYVVLNANHTDVDFRLADRDEVLKEELLGTTGDSINESSDEFFSVL